MKFVATLSARLEPPAVSTRLVVVVSTDDSTWERVIAYGVDPDQREVIFTRVLMHEDLGTFLDYVIDGNSKALTTFSSSNSTPVAMSVDVSTSKPPPIGPSAAVLIEYASTVVTTEGIAYVA
jgi:hypothetical protein